MPFFTSCNEIWKIMYMILIQGPRSRGTGERYRLNFPLINALCFSSPYALSNGSSAKQATNQLVWENSRHFATSSLVSPRNDVWETSAEIQYWWVFSSNVTKCRLFSQAANQHHLGSTWGRKIPRKRKSSSALVWMMVSCCHSVHGKPYYSIHVLQHDNKGRGER